LTLDLGQTKGTTTRKMNYSAFFRSTITCVVVLTLTAGTNALAPSGGITVSRSATSSLLKIGQPTLNGSFQNRRSRRDPLRMSVEGDFDPEAISKAKEAIDSGSIKAKFKAFYKFSRPHTIRGSILASIAGTTRALIDTPGAIGNANWAFMLPRAFIGMISLLFGNVFIVGINQIYDKEIDEMNKPFLPVASGEMTKRAAWFSVLSTGVIGPILVKNFFPPLLFKLYCFGLFLGGIYSVPPIRTKKNPLLAGLTIATVRGFLLNFGVYYAVKDAIGAPFAWSPKVAFIARFMTAFATVIAVTKDLPDVEGDKVRITDGCQRLICIKKALRIAAI
jgi:homogentisate solanesyltransferase